MLMGSKRPVPIWMTVCGKRILLGLVPNRNRKGINSMDNSNKLGLSDTQLLSQNSANKIKHDVRSFLSSAKQAGLSPQHTMEMNGLFLNRVKSWEEAYEYLCHRHLPPKGAKLKSRTTCCQKQAAFISAPLSHTGGKK